MGSKIHSLISMDFLRRPTSAFENLTMTDSLSPATTALENLSISGRNTEKNKPCNQNLINPAPMLSPEESFRLCHQTALITLFYGPPKTCQSCTRLEVSNQEKFQRSRYMYLRKKIIGELSNMEDKPEHREKLELVKSYVYQRQKQEEVLSIVFGMCIPKQIF